MKKNNGLRKSTQSVVVLLTTLLANASIASDVVVLECLGEEIYTRVPDPINLSKNSNEFPKFDVPRSLESDLSKSLVEVYPMTYRFALDLVSKKGQFQHDCYPTGSSYFSEKCKSADDLGGWFDLGAELEVGPVIIRSDHEWEYLPGDWGFHMSEGHLKVDRRSLTVTYQDFSDKYQYVSYECINRNTGPITGWDPTCPNLRGFAGLPPLREAEYQLFVSGDRVEFVGTCHIDANPNKF